MESESQGKLKPGLCVDALGSIDLKTLKNKGIKGLIIDLDNTICPWNQNKVTNEADVFIKKALALDYKVCLISNASYNRTREIAQNYCIPFIAPALKPWKRSFMAALRRMELQNAAVAVIGDQIFTDIYGGNKAGCFTILVPPLDKKEFIWTRFMRKLEKHFFKRRLT